MAIRGLPYLLLTCVNSVGILRFGDLVQDQAFGQTPREITHARKHKTGHP